jgi:hypothetical protein
MSFVFRRIKREMLLALGAAWLLFGAPGVRGQKTFDTAIFTLPAGIKILIHANPKAATVGDSIQLDLDIIMPPAYQAEIPKPVAQSADISVIDFFPGPSLPEKNKSQEFARALPSQAGASVHHRARIVIAIYKTGKFTFPPIPVKIKTAEGKEIAASSPPVDIQIQSVLTEKNPTLKDLKKQAEIPEPTRWLLWGSLALATCLLGAIAWYFWRQRRRKPGPLTPAQKQDLLELAEADLHHLLAQGFPEKGKEKQFYVLFSEIVKRILSAGYGIHTAEQTTSEIMEALDRNSVPGSEERKRIESFLLRCDVVKFAKYVPSGDEHASTADDALRILAGAKETVGSRQSPVIADCRLPTAD